MDLDLIASSLGQYRIIPLPGIPTVVTPTAPNQQCLLGVHLGYNVSQQDSSPRHESQLRKHMHRQDPHSYHGVGTASRANLFRSVLCRSGEKEKERPGKGKASKQNKIKTTPKTSKSGVSTYVLHILCLSTHVINQKV